MTTIQRINQLSAERSQLYGLAARERRGDPTVRGRTEQIGREIEALWSERRRQRVGRPEGIDRLIDRAYERVYGQGYDDTVAQHRVDATDEDEAAGVAA